MCGGCVVGFGGMERERERERGVTLTTLDDEGRKSGVGRLGETSIAGGSRLVLCCAVLLALLYSAFLLLLTTLHYTLVRAHTSKQTDGQTSKTQSSTGRHRSRGTTPRPRAHGVHHGHKMSNSNFLGRAIDTVKKVCCAVPCRCTCLRRQEVDSYAGRGKRHRRRI